MSHRLEFTMSISSGNSGMQSAADVARALRQVADRLDAGDADTYPHGVRDINGNTVGTWSLTLPTETGDDD
jgi:hypothetical protein